MGCNRGLTTWSAPKSSEMQMKRRLKMRTLRNGQCIQGWTSTWLLSQGPEDHGPVWVDETSISRHTQARECLLTDQSCKGSSRTLCVQARQMFGQSRRDLTPFLFRVKTYHNKLSGQHACTQGRRGIEICPGLSGCNCQTIGSPATRADQSF